MVEGFDEMDIDDFRGRGRRGLGPPRGDDRGVFRRPEDVLDLQPVPILPRGIQLRRLCEGFGRLLRAAQFVEDFRPVRPGPFEGGIRFQKSVVVFELLRKSVRLRGRCARRGHPLPAAEEVFHDALATGRDFRRGGHGGPADRALWLIGEQVGPAPGAERTGLVEDRREGRQERELRGAVLSAAHDTGGRVFVHRRTAGLADPSRDVLTQEVVQFRREPSPRGPFELDPAERTSRRARSYKRTALGTKEQMFGGITIRRSSEKNQERVHERGGESLHGCELLAGGRPSSAAPNASARLRFASRFRTRRSVGYARRCRPSSATVTSPKPDSSEAILLADWRVRCTRSASSWNEMPGDSNTVARVAARPADASAANNAESSGSMSPTGNTRVPSACR